MSEATSDTLETTAPPRDAGPSADVPVVVVKTPAVPPAVAREQREVEPKPEQPTLKMSEEPFAVSRVPWAFLVAMLCLLGVEIGMRSADPRDVIPYQNTGRQSYAAVRNYLHLVGPARVGFLGSSRGREAIMVPVVRDTLKEALGRHVSIANYSSPAAAADEVDQILRIMFRQEDRPQILLYGVSPLQISESALKTDHAGELWYVSDWWREVQYRLDERDAVLTRAAATRDREERRRLTRAANDVFQRNTLPDVIRNEIGIRFMTFGCREIVGNRFAAFVSNDALPPCPLTGQLSESQKKKKQRTLAEKPVTRRRVVSYLSKRMEGDRYPLGGRQLEHFRSIMAQCAANEVTLIVYELPLPEILQENYPAGTMERFHQLIEQMTAEAGVRYVRHAELGLSFTDADFREQSHMNNAGAEKLSEALAMQIIAPALQR